MQSHFPAVVWAWTQVWTGNLRAHMPFCAHNRYQNQEAPVPSDKLNPPWTIQGFKSNVFKTHSQYIFLKSLATSEGEWWARVWFQCSLDWFYCSFTKSQVSLQRSTTPNTFYHPHHCHVSFVYPLQDVNVLKY